MKKVLIAIDDSKSAMKAVEYAGQQFSGIGDLQIALVHVLPNLPAMFWDEGHFLSEQEKAERKKVVDKWLADWKAKMEPVFRKAIEVLASMGINMQQIQTKSISDTTDVAQSILEEARDRGYQTIIVGRRGVAGGKHTLIGSVTSKIINQGSGIAVTVVE
ncbi:MAG: universal stress protein [Syntrophaceae bacterium]